MELDVPRNEVERCVIDDGERTLKRKGGWRIKEIALRRYCDGDTT